MSEKNFQMALLHLYENVDRQRSYSDAMFEQFALSPSQKQWLNELMTSQLDGLLLFNEQLHKKRRRLIRHALPQSRDTIGHQLETLLDDYELHSAREGAADPVDAVRLFADYVGAQIDRCGDASAALEFIRFEALYASVSLQPDPPDPSADGPPRLSDELRLSSGGDAVLVACNYDAAAVMKDPSRLKTASRLAAPRWFFLFRDRGGAVRIFTVAAALAKVLSLFRDGLSLRDVLRTLDGETARTAASASVEKLLLRGAPFFLPRAPADGVHALSPANGGMLVT